jgi:hypothetical protein
MTSRFILQDILNSTSFKAALPLLMFTDNQLTGAVEVTEDKRKKQLKYMHIEDRVSNMTNKVTEVFSAEQQFKCKNTEKPHQMICKKKNIGYSQNQYSESQKDKLVESLDLVFYVKSLDKVVGYLSIEVSFTREGNNSCFSVTLDDIYVGSEHTDKEYWLDLTITAIDFLNAILSEIYTQMDKTLDLEVLLSSNLSGFSGSKISYTVLRRMRQNLRSHIRKHQNFAERNCLVFAYFELDDALNMNVF